MPNQKISELTAIVTVDNSVDVLPIVDISANTTKKVTPNALKTALALDNVNNTSDANKPVSIAQQDALNAKVDENAPITAGTAPKITYDAKGLVTSGDSLDETDLPTGINANKIGTGAVSSTEFGYLDGVTSAIQTQIDGKQATLVSGTNIKTINSTSLLGSGDIAISANPSGVAGAIQFSDGSAFASDAAQLFWDDTNNRLGIGTNAPIESFSVQKETAGFAMATFIGHKGVTNYNGLRIGTHTNAVGYIQGISGSSMSATYDIYLQPFGGGVFIGSSSTTPAARLQVRGSGSTSATTSLLVQNSAGTQLLKVPDNGNLEINPTGGRPFVFTNEGVTMSSDSTFALRNSGGQNSAGIKLQVYDNTFGYRTAIFIDKPSNSISVGINTDSPNASAILDATSTTKGFLPPRMTTTQKNAIASPAAGLVVYDSTTNKLCCYNGSTWNDLF
jgi:hypothetical protein